MAYTDNPVNATAEQVEQAVQNSIPKVAPLFWSFRVMVAAGFIMLLVFALSFYHSAKKDTGKTTLVTQSRFILFTSTMDSL